VDRVIIWTKITPNQNSEVNVKWMAPKDVSFKKYYKIWKNYY